MPFEPPDTGTGINNVSAVLDLHFGARRLLLMGDVEEAIDPQLIAAGIADGRRLDLLKVAHHGSRTASTEAFLGALRPRVAVISAGTGNPYGHPTRQTLDRLAAVGARAFRTDTDGTVTIETDGHDLRVAASGGRASAGRWRRADGEPQRQAGRRESAVIERSAIRKPRQHAGRCPAGDPAARYRCATPRIGPWIPAQAGTAGISTSRRVRRLWPWEAWPRPPARAMSVAATNLAYFWGEDAWGMERAVRRMALALGGDDRSWRRARGRRHAPGDLARRCRCRDRAGGMGSAARLLDRIAERLGTAPLFGGGTLVVLRQPAPLLREKASRERLARAHRRRAARQCPGHHRAGRRRLAPVEGRRGPARSGQGAWRHRPRVPGADARAHGALDHASAPASSG